MQANIENIQVALDATDFRHEHQQENFMSTMQLSKPLGKVQRNLILPEFQGSLGAPHRKWVEPIIDEVETSPILAVINHDIQTGNFSTLGMNAELKKMERKDHLREAAGLLRMRQRLTSPMNLSLQSSLLFNQKLLLKDGIEL